jgi:hypothetical protein
VQGHASSQLEPVEIIATADQLTMRIRARFPDSGLLRVSEQVRDTAEHARARGEWISRPRRGLRVAVCLVIALILAASIAGLALVDFRTDGLGLGNVLPLLEAAINDLVLIGAAIFFLTTVETRSKRRQALAAIHELRSLAHIVDMHQLAKDPERLRGGAPRTDVSPSHALTRFELGRYLDYCSELLSLCGKIAALYAQGFEDDVTLCAVNEVENLCTGLSRKIWQKIMILPTLSEAEAPALPLRSALP